MRWVMLCGFTLLYVCCVPASAEEGNRQEQLARIERAIAAGTAFMIRQQDADGAWRSKTYGLLKDGTSLTPLAVWAIGTEDAERTARDRGFIWMSNWFVTEGGQTRLVVGPQYPVYAAGLCLSTMDRTEIQSGTSQIAALMDRIRILQLNDQNGWSCSDSEYGGWGYSHESPRRPRPGDTLSPLDEPNLSATVFALEGLAAESHDRASPARQAAMIFVSRCQNLRLSDSSESSDPGIDARFNDGGFHFMRHDPVRNKPGVAGIDRRGETRFVSYGSATADGLRALLLCGAEPPDPRVTAAQRWLLSHFGNGSHPGSYPTERSSLKPSLDFYYAASVAHAFVAVPVAADDPLGNGEWAMRLSRLLISRQHDAGSWSNSSVDIREDDPLVATPLALRSLHFCRHELQRLEPQNR